MISASSVSACHNPSTRGYCLKETRFARTENEDVQPSHDPLGGLVRARLSVPGTERLDGRDHRVDGGAVDGLDVEEARGRLGTDRPPGGLRRGTRMSRTAMPLRPR